MTRPLLVILSVSLWLSGCHAAGETPRDIAEAFLDRYYVGMDLAAARDLCAAVALDKIDEQIALTGGLVADGAADRPSVNYRLGYTDETADRANYEYDLRVAPSGVSPFSRRVLLTLRPSDGRWLVTNYAESDPRAAAANGP